MRLPVERFANTRRERSNVCDFELGEKNCERHSRKNGEMESGASGGAKGFRGEGAGGAGLAGGGGDSSCGAESGGSTKDGADVAGILDACENHKECRSWSPEQIIERGCARMD